jgi:hypothetical protein
MFVIGRHSDRSNELPSGITSTGESRAAWSASKLPRGMTLHLRTAPKTRHRTTAGIVFEKYAGEKGTNTELASVNIDGYAKDVAKVEELMKTIGDPKVTNMWLSGEIGSNVMVPAKEVGRTILNDVFSEFKRTESTGRKNLLVAVSSTGAEGAILKSLGVELQNLVPKKSKVQILNQLSLSKAKAGDLMRFTEGMLFFVGPKNELIMKFRGRAFRLVKVKGNLTAVKM